MLFASVCFVSSAVALKALGYLIHRPSVVACLSGLCCASLFVVFELMCNETEVQMEDIILFLCKNVLETKDKVHVCKCQPTAMWALFMRYFTL
jgi:hypothetical protein